MSIRDRLSGNEAIATAMRQINPDVFAMFPITPSTEIPQYFAQYVADGKVDNEFICVESEHSSMSACIGAEAAGCRAKMCIRDRNYTGAYWPEDGVGYYAGTTTSELVTNGDGSAQERTYSNNFFATFDGGERYSMLTFPEVADYMIGDTFPFDTLDEMYDQDGLRYICLLYTSKSKLPINGPPRGTTAPATHVSGRFVNCFPAMPASWTSAAAQGAPSTPISPGRDILS